MFEYKFEYEIKMKLCNENKTNYKKNNSKNRLAILQHFSFLVLFKNISMYSGQQSCLALQSNL